MRVIVQGRLKQRCYETREGEKRTVIELDVDEVGPSLKYASAKVNKPQRGSGGFGGGGGCGGGSGAAAAVAAPGGPTTRGARPRPPAAAGGGFSDEPPF